MTIEEVKKAAEVMIAFAEGAKIQYSHKGQNNWINWINKFPPSFDLQAFDYRIKPKSKYRPFKNQEECWNEMHKHPDFGWLKSKHNGSVRLIGTLYKKDKVPMIIWATNEFNHFSSSYLFDEYVFTDGAPFGIKEE